MLIVFSLAIPLVSNAEEIVEETYAYNIRDYAKQNGCATHLRLVTCRSLRVLVIT